MLTLHISSRDRDATRRLFADSLGLASDSPDRYPLGQVNLAIHDPGDDDGTGPCLLTVRADDPTSLTNALAEIGHRVDDPGRAVLALKRP